MKFNFHSLLSTAEATDAAVDDVLSLAEGEDVKADALFIFFTADHSEQAEEMVEKLWLELDPQVAIGCVAEGVIGADKEVERQPGLAVLAATMPDVRIHPFHIAAEEWERMLTDRESFAERLALGEESRALIGFGDPFTTPLNQLLPVLDDLTPRIPLIGGMASGSRTPGDNLLVRNDEIFRDGFVGLSLAGPIEVQTIVSQGCRPIAHTFVITKAHDNVIEQLGGKPALDVLRGLIHDLPERDQALLQNGLLIGRAISEYRESFGRGDFLVRNLIGIDQPNKALALADYVRVGQTIQFHVRDAHTADEDLGLMLQSQQSNPPAGGLLFSCNGRGTRLFEQPCHDITVARASMPATPIAGFFAAGEFGPVGNKNFIHGHAASFALFRPLTTDH